MSKFLQAILWCSVTGGTLTMPYSGLNAATPQFGSEGQQSTTSTEMESSAAGQNLPLWPVGGRAVLERLPVPATSFSAPDQADLRESAGNLRGSNELTDRSANASEISSLDSMTTVAAVSKGILGGIATQRNAPPPVDEFQLQRLQGSADEGLQQGQAPRRPPVVVPSREALDSDQTPLEHSAADVRDQRQNFAGIMVPRKVSHTGPDPTILPIETKPAAVEDLTPRLRPAIVQQAQGHINEGIRLARMSAVYSARAHFVKVVRLVSQALDAESGSKRYSQALAAGLRALDEAAHFRPRGARLEADLDIAQIVRTHRTPVLRQQDLGQVTSLAAMQMYHAYAEQQLAIAGGHELVAADAYYGLAKLQGHLDSGPVNEIRVGPRAMIYYQTALIVCPKHFMAANELGVIFARFGQLEDAREVLRFGAREAPGFAELWFNLARVHERLGEDRLASLAMQEYELIRQQKGSPRAAVAKNRPTVEWMDPVAFAQNQPPTSMPRKVTPQASTSDAGWPFR